MNAILLTMLALGGADAAAYGGGLAGPAAQPALLGGSAGGFAGDCDACNGGGYGHGHGGGCLHDCCGPMPQSCYNPSFGCYPSTRFMHRYPAFHNYYYRSAYNYRHYFDYPWHAGLHEPTSMFSYHVPGAGPAESIPVPLPAVSREPTTRPDRTATGAGSAIAPRGGQR
jgi:hypothetical protein